jgi:lauroyl/myristoyl acyltransferase
LTIHEAYRLSELEMVNGDLRSIEHTEIGLIAAVIGKITVLLPEELAGQLQALVGKIIGILRLDGYHIRCFDKEAR